LSFTSSGINLLGGWCPIWANRDCGLAKSRKKEVPLYALLSWKIRIYNLDWKTDLNKIGLMFTGLMGKALVLITPGAYEGMLLSSTNM
jgi:hypothetical protein